MKILEKEKIEKHCCKCSCLFEYSIYDVFLGRDYSKTIYCPKCNKQIRIESVI